MNGENNRGDCVNNHPALSPEPPCAVSNCANNGISLDSEQSVINPTPYEERYRKWLLSNPCKTTVNEGVLLCSWED